LSISAEHTGSKLERLASLSAVGLLELKVV